MQPRSHEKRRRSRRRIDRKSTRLNSSHVSISYAVFCLKKKKLHRKSPPNRLPFEFTISNLPNFFLTTVSAALFHLPHDIPYPFQHVSCGSIPYLLSTNY